MSNRSPYLPLIVAAVVGGAALMNVAPAFAQGQSNVGSTNIASLEYQQVDVREALRKLFQITKVSFTIDPMVQGTVSLSLKNVSFDTALQNLTRQVDATYRIEGGVYQVVPRHSEPTQEPGSVKLAPAPSTPGSGPFMVVDGNFLFVMHDGVVDKVDKRTMKLIGTATLSRKE